ncbi:hypothetical protein C8J57DRAFT_1481307 [Mycena rebaudengoi]|nr:hypothetical protein C8J57DRAFT_1481307 [Mycena rebaudengoi]
MFASFTSFRNSLSLLLVIQSAVSVVSSALNTRATDGEAIAKECEGPCNILLESVSLNHTLDEMCTDAVMEKMVVCFNCEVGAAAQGGFSVQQDRQREADAFVANCQKNNHTVKGVTIGKSLEDLPANGDETTSGRPANGDESVSGPQEGRGEVVSPGIFFAAVFGLITFSLAML